MKDLFGYFDEYTLKARFLPACIAGLPLLALIASYFDWNKFLISNVIVGVLIGFLMVFLLSNVARYMGKKVEKMRRNHSAAAPQSHKTLGKKRQNLQKYHYSLDVV